MQEEDENARFVEWFRTRGLHKLADSLDEVLDESWEDMLKRCEKSREQAQQEWKARGLGMGNKRGFP